MMNKAADDAFARARFGAVVPCARTSPLRCLSSSAGPRVVRWRPAGGQHAHVTATRNGSAGRWVECSAHHHVTANPDREGRHVHKHEEHDADCA